jgi:hypothetical protein
MFKFLKRSVPTPKPRPKEAPKRKAAGTSRGFDARTEPGPLPEVTEGNEQTDWALWEDSVVALDSQMQGLSSSMQGLTSSVRIYDKPVTPSEYQDIDAFARVTKKDA